MKYANRVEDTVASVLASGLGDVTLAGTPPALRQGLSAIGTTGDTFPYSLEQGSVWEQGIGTITTISPPAFSRAPAGGAAPVAFSAGAHFFHNIGASTLAKLATASDATVNTLASTATSTVLIEESGATKRITGDNLVAATATPLATYLATNAATTPSGSDLLLADQSGTIGGMALTPLASFIMGTFTSARTTAVNVATTTPFPLDFSAHHRRRIICSSAATINFPALYSTVGDDFECKVSNISGGVVTFGAGIVCLPSGSTIPNGGTADVFANSGNIYAVLPQVGGGVAPGQVTGLALTSPTTSGLTASWTAPATGTAPFSYSLQYRVTGAGSWSTIAVGSGITTYALTGLTSNTSYDVQVAANNGTTGTYSTIATASTAAIAVPGQATGVTLGAATSSTQPLTWTAPSSGGAVSTYTIEYRLTGGSTYTVASSGSVTGLAYTVTGLTASTGYDYRVTAVNGGGSGTPSTVASGSTAAASAFAVTSVSPAGLGTSGAAMTFNITYTGTLGTPTVTVDGSSVTPGSVTDLGSGSATFTIPSAPAPWDYSGAGVGHSISVTGTTGSANTSRFATQTANIAFPYTPHVYFSTMPTTESGLPKNADIEVYLQMGAGTLVRDAVSPAVDAFSSISTFYAGYSLSNSTPPPGPLVINNNHVTGGQWLAPMIHNSNTVWHNQYGSLYDSGTYYYWFFVKDTSGNTQIYVSPFTVTM